MHKLMLSTALVLPLMMGQAMAQDTATTPAPADPDYRHPRTYRLSELPRTCQALVAR